MIESAIYKGKVYHQRFKPTLHKFDYDIYLFWLKLESNELEILSNILSTIVESLLLRSIDFRIVSRAVLQESVLLYIEFEQVLFFSSQLLE